MAYTAWSVVYGEQPTAAKWNQLGQNDAGFKDGTNIDNSVILNRHVGANELYASKIYNPYKFSAYLSVAQTLAISTWTKVALNVEDFDTSNNFDSTTNRRFTAPVSGYYMIAAQVGITTSGVSNGYMQAALYKNGTGYLYSSRQAASGSDTSLLRGVIAKLVYLAANDYLELYGLHTDSTSARDIAGGSNTTYFTGHLVSST